MPILVDGYNLLRSVEKLTETDTVTDISLCRLISNYLRCIGELGEIIFDGTGPRDKAGFSNMPNLAVAFSGARHDADTIIEFCIAENSAPKRLLVVSTDRRLRNAAHKRKAMAVDSEFFWAEMTRCLARISKRKKTAEPLEKLQGISIAETEFWLKVFGFKGKS